VWHSCTLASPADPLLQAKGRLQTCAWAVRPCLAFPAAPPPGVTLAQRFILVPSAEWHDAHKAQHHGICPLLPGDSAPGANPCRSRCTSATSFLHARWVLSKASVAATVHPAAHQLSTHVHQLPPCALGIIKGSHSCDSYGNYFHLQYSSLCERARSVVVASYNLGCGYNAPMQCKLIRNHSGCLACSTYRLLLLARS
jgi:hypothetical protein